MSTPSLARRLLAALSPAEYQRQFTEASAHINEAFPSQQIGFYSDPGFGMGIIESDPTKRLEVQQSAYALWQGNPLGGSIINWTVMFVMGGGVAVSHPDPRVNEYLQMWWEWNNMDEMQDKWCEELAVFGELFLEKIVNDGGRMSVVSIDPRTIDAIRTDPLDVRKVISYHQRFTSTTYESTNKSTTTQEERTIPASDIIHSKVNSASFAKFGTSDLMRVLAPIPMYARWLADRARINWMKNNYFIEVTVKGGGTPTDKVLARIKKIGRHMNPGSMVVHGDNEVWEIKQPQIAAGDASEDGRAIKLYVAAGANLPEYLLGDASNANLASTKSQEMPLVKKFRKRQKHIARLLRTIFSDVIRQAIAANDCPATFTDVGNDGKQVTRPSDSAEQFVITFPKIVEADVKATVEAFMPLFTAGLVSGRSVVSEVGLDYDEEQTLRRQEEEANDQLEQQTPDDAEDDDPEDPTADDAAGDAPGDGTPPPAAS